MRMLSIKAGLFTFCGTAALASVVSPAHAVSSAELYTLASYPYGRFEARVRFAGGDGIVGSFFLWKDGSEKADVFWNELDLETVWADCELFTNALYGLPEAVHSESSGTAGNWCGSFHTYSYEWTPDYVAWFVDGMELRRETGEDSTAFRDNAAEGMQIHFNLWPGDSTFGGNFNAASLPVHEYINWVQYSSFANGTFTVEWREDFSGDTLPEGWATGDWGSPKGLSTHAPANVTFVDGYAVISMTADDATGFTGTVPMDPEGAGPIAEPEPAVDDGEPSEPEPQGQPGGAPGDDGVPPGGAGPVGSGGATSVPTSTPGVAGMNVGGPPPSNDPGVPPGTGGSGGPVVTPPAQPGTPPAPGAAPPSDPGAVVPGAVTPSGPVDDVGTNGATPPAAGEPGAPASSTEAPTMASSDAGSDGGCAVVSGTAPARGWLLLTLGLSLGSLFRRRRRGTP